MTVAWQHMAKGRSQQSSQQDPNLAGFDDFGRKIAKLAFKQGWIARARTEPPNPVRPRRADNNIGMPRQHAPRIQKNTLARVFF